MREPIIAVIGAGNMGGSIIHGLVKQGYTPSHIIAVDAEIEKINALQKQLNIIPSSDANQAVTNADIILIAVKPQLFKMVALQLKVNLQDKRRLIISIAAGITLKSMRHWFGDNAPIIRAMPNTPAMIGCGITAMVANSLVTPEDKANANTIMDAIGASIWLGKENLLDIVTALSGSGPAYFFLMMEALEQSATALGLPEEISHQLTLHTAYGAALMAVESELPLATLRKNVTSPGGTTEKALTVLEAHHIKDIFNTALTAAKKRSEELAKLAED